MLIVNADDYGMSEDVNEAIAESFARGWITSTTALANGRAFEHGVRLARERGFADRVGVHLCLTEGEPLSQPIRLQRRFTGNDGALAFRRNASPFLTAAEWRAVHEEFCAQIKRCKEAYPAVVHADSHHHVHTEWMIGLAAVAAARRHWLRALRLTDNVRPAGLARRSYKRLFNAMLGASGLDYCQYFCDLQGVERVASACSDARARVELMVHPVLDSTRQVVDADFGARLGQLRQARLASFSEDGTIGMLPGYPARQP